LQHFHNTHCIEPYKPGSIDENGVGEGWIRRMIEGWGVNHFELMLDCKVNTIYVRISPGQGWKNKVLRKKIYVFRFLRF